MGFSHTGASSQGLPPRFLAAQVTGQIQPCTKKEPERAGWTWSAWSKDEGRRVRWECPGQVECQVFWHQVGQEGPCWTGSESRGQGELTTIMALSPVEAKEELHMRASVNVWVPEVGTWSWPKSRRRWEEGDIWMSTCNEWLVFLPLPYT